MSLRLVGLCGANPLGFMASLGVLRLCTAVQPDVRLSFDSSGSYEASLHNFQGHREALVALIVQSARAIESQPIWWLTYAKQEKSGVKMVADLKAPPDVFHAYARRCVEAWVMGDDEPAAFAAAFGTSVARDSKGNTKPTAFHFTAANQQFLDSAKKIAALLTETWIHRSLFEGHADVPGMPNLRWDPAAERNWALMASNPNTEGTRGDAPLEWLGFCALPLFTTFPRGDRIVTTAVEQNKEAIFRWPLWSVPMALTGVRSILRCDWTQKSEQRRMRGIFSLCESGIRRSSQGFGNFGPATVEP